MALTVRAGISGIPETKAAMDKLAAEAEKAEAKAAAQAEKAAAKVEAAKLREEKAAQRAAAQAEAASQRAAAAAERAAQRAELAKQKEALAAEKAAQRAEAARQKEAAAAEASAARQAAAVARAGHAEASAAMRRTSDATRQLTFAVQDLLSGGAMGGLKGALLGASNNLAVVAMQFGGLAGVITSIAVSALPLFISQTKKSTEETRDFAAALDEATAAAKRRAEISALPSAGADDEIRSLIAKRQLIKQTAEEEEKALVDQLMLSQRFESREAAMRDPEAAKALGKIVAEADAKRLAVNQEIALLVERSALAEHGERIDKELSAKAEEKQRQALGDQLDIASRAVQLAAEQADEEKRASDAKIEAAKQSLDPKEVARAQEEVTSSIKDSLDEVRRLNAELEKTSDPRKAGFLAESMNRAADAAKKAKDDLAALNEQQARAQEADDTQRERQQYLKELDEHYSRVEDMARQHEARMREIRIGKIQGQLGDQAGSLLNNQSPEDIARALAEQRTGDTTGKDFQKAFRQAMNQANGGFEAYSQAEIADAIKSNIAQQSVAMHQSGQFSNEMIAALVRSANEQAEQAMEIENLRRELANIAQFQEAIAGDGRRRRNQKN